MEVVDLQLTEDQQKASTVFTQFLLDKDAKYMVIQGDSGTGKSTLINHLLKEMNVRIKLYSILLGSEGNKKHLSIQLTATTNKAAGVLADVTNFPVTTIYSFLGLTPKHNFSTGEINFIPGKQTMKKYNQMIIIDEASFISTQLFGYIDELTENCKILLVGDQYQLAPINQTTATMQTLDCYRASLSQIIRHGGAIAETGAKFKNAVETGVFSPLIADGTNILHVDGTTFKKMIDEEFTHPDYTESKAKILAWSNDTVNKYNTHIRRIRGCSELYEIGDVLYTNKPILYKNQVVANTDTNVRIADIVGNTISCGIPGRNVVINNVANFFLPNDPVAANNYLKQLRTQKRWIEYFRLQEEWLDLRPAFASTVHKAQGSTYDRVYINLSDITKCKVATDVARMLYVAITRSSKQVILYGQLYPVYMGLYNTDPSKPDEANYDINTVITG